MPGIFTHYLAGGKVLEKLADKRSKEIIEGSRGVFDFGLQGPDFFSYFGAPYKSDESINRVTMALRTRTINEWLFTVYRYIKAQSEDDAAILKPYFLGYLVYYRVNCAINPYISYRVGFQTPGAELPERFDIYRNRFTTGMDEAMLNKETGKTPSQMDIDKIFWVTYAQLLEITRLYPLHLKRILGRDISRDQAIKAAQDMNRLAKKRIKPGITKLFVSIYETLSKDVYKGTYTSTVYGKQDAEIDYLNDKGTVWYMPWDNRQQHTETVEELYNKGIDEAAKLIDTVVAGYNGELTDIQVRDALGNDSMLTGVAWNAPFLPKHFDCVYKKDEEKLAKKIAALEKERLKNE